MSDFGEKNVRFRKKHADIGDATPKCLKYKLSDKGGSILKQQGQTVHKTTFKAKTLKSKDGEKLIILIRNHYRSYFFLFKGKNEKK